MVFAHRRTNTHTCTLAEKFSRGVLSAQNKTLIFPLPADVPSKLLRPIFEKVPNMSDKEMYPQVLKDKRSSWSKVPSYLRTKVFIYLRTKVINKLRINTFVLPSLKVHSYLITLLRIPSYGYLGIY